MGDSGGEYLAAFSNNWTNTSFMRSASRRTVISSGTRISTGCLPRTCFTSATARLYQVEHATSLQIELKFVGLELRDLGRLADQPVQAIAFFVDDSHQFLAIVRAQAVVRTSGW